ncbi:MAG: ribonuclease III [Firmicutes bacterium]|nr:ribonuclease III [Bacillota bacterium]
MFGRTGKIGNPIELPSVVLAYIGDAVYELAVREYLISCGLVNVNKLHREAVRHVCASSQASLFHALEDRLTPMEQAVIRRGRNAKSGHAPRGNNVIAYRESTGFESLVGYLYLKQEWSRLEEIISLARRFIEEELQ